MNFIIYHLTSVCPCEWHCYILKYVHQTELACGVHNPPSSKSAKVNLDYLPMDGSKDSKHVSEPQPSSTMVWNNKKLPKRPETQSTYGYLYHMPSHAQRFTKQFVLKVSILVYNLHCPIDGKHMTWWPIQVILREAKLGITTMHVLVLITTAAKGIFGSLSDHTKITGIHQQT